MENFFTIEGHYCTFLGRAGSWSIYWFVDDTLGAVSPHYSQIVKVPYTSLDLTQKSKKTAQECKKIGWAAMGALLANA